MREVNRGAPESVGLYWDNPPSSEVSKIREIYKDIPEIGIGKKFQVQPVQRLYLPQFQTSALVTVEVEMGFGSESDMADGWKPFQPEKGYRLDEKDFNFDDRYEKLDALRRYADNMPRGGSNTNSGFLMVDLLMEKMPETSGLQHSTYDPEWDEFIKNLHLQIFFPGSSISALESSPTLPFHEEIYEDGQDTDIMNFVSLEERNPAFWSQFYPLDVGGPLPNNVGSAGPESEQRLVSWGHTINMRDADSGRMNEASTRFLSRQLTNKA